MIATYAPITRNRVSHADRSVIDARSGLTLAMTRLLSASIFHTKAFTKTTIIADYRPTHTPEAMMKHYADRDAWEKLVALGFIIKSSTNTRRWEVDIEKARTVLPLACEYRDIRSGK